MEQCTIGKALKEDCHITSDAICKTTGFHKVSELEHASIQLLQWRSGVTFDSGDHNTVCFYHEKVLISRYESLQKSCCDPFKRHKKLIKSKIYKYYSASIDLHFLLRNDSKQMPALPLLFFQFICSLIYEKSETKCIRYRSLYIY